MAENTPSNNKAVDVPNFDSTMQINDKMAQKQSIRQQRSGFAPETKLTEDEKLKARGFLDHLVTKKPSGQGSSTS